jgi:hypothetical protein
MHRRRALAIAIAALASTTLVACGDDTGLSDNSYDIDFDFTNGIQGWVAGFADYPVGKEAEWGLNSSLAALPLPLDVTRKAILLTGTNHSDDLFMYITQGVTGLVPNAQYAARFRVTLATNAPRNCAGIGGAPGESVVLKVGGTSTQPARIVDAQQYYRASFDHGSQLATGRDAANVGNLANSNTNCTVPRYELKEFDSGSSNNTGIIINSDASGRLWLVVGIDSGFEGTTTVYITRVSVELNPR